MTFTKTDRVQDEIEKLMSKFVKVLFLLALCLTSCFVVFLIEVVYSFSKMNSVIRLLSHETYTGESRNNNFRQNFLNLKI